MLDLSRIRAITLDLDDTLWPVWPTIHRAEQVLSDWLAPDCCSAWAATSRARASFERGGRADALASLISSRRRLST